ncbi:GAF and ANTAR domain-containing protein [Mycobacterium parmense]|uniref:Transcriptional regulator n=1 Tax=Mycobacterium parmense TaxID=185642 RepID=A0A7I7YR11_9MYCO|nr:GAF and ANTAR domain-containing protein [Mycobacterium parmense]MCV7348798.1 GAF and ANTAR domain-containing protein [Mycobacterium parmense]ORW49662.1 hypothetical protein AWC20_03490 [Mycobacterium parmense]BBZ44308.1 transcriptional regulator [Mycobacterium parmense]
MASVLEPVSPSGEQSDGQVPTTPRELDLLTDGAWSCLQQLARSLRVDEADRDATLKAIVVKATATIDPVEAAGVILLEKGKVIPQAVHGEAPAVLDRLQQRTGAGPCIDASRDQRSVEITDMRTDGRWPKFGQRAIELGVHSMLCLPLWIDDRTLGSLSLYAGLPAAFEDTARRFAELFATHAALAIGDAQRTGRLRRAMINRDLIGQAKGILMERHRITADEAHDLLVRASKHTNRKVVDLAGDLVTTGGVHIP